MLIFWPISSLGDAYKRYLSDAYKKKHVARDMGDPARHIAHVHLVCPLARATWVILLATSLMFMLSSH